VNPVLYRLASTVIQIAIEFCPYKKILTEAASAMKYLDYCRRLFGTALSFAVFGVAGLVMGLVLFPFLFVFVRDGVARQRVARRLIGHGFGAFVCMMKWLGVLTFEISGRENLDEARNHLIVANHPTLIDVVFLVSMFPHADCVIKEAVIRNPFMRSTVMAANYISNEALEDLLSSCVERVRAGGSLLLFPEGTRTAPGKPIEFKPGAATVAVRSDVRVLPIAIDCTPLFLMKEKPWYYVPPSRPHFSIRIMPPVSPRELVPEPQDQRHTRHAMNEALRALITGALGHGPMRTTITTSST
jgi:1-acyl-sn-glycerol-3-phosphate acyltransferase